EARARDFRAPCLAVGRVDIAQGGHFAIVLLDEDIQQLPTAVARADHADAHAFVRGVGPARGETRRKRGRSSLQRRAPCYRSAHVESPPGPRRYCAACTKASEKTV